MQASVQHLFRPADLFGRVIHLLIFLGAGLFISACADRDSASVPNYTAHIDTSVAVYGPYQAVKLPIQNGVEIANPIQLSLGPGGILYAANQTGEVYSLRDTDDDGLEDTALLFANVKDWGLRSPTGFAHRGDTIYIGTAQQVRAFLDLDKDGDADSSWVFFDEIPFSEHPYEWSCGLTFGPDGWMYVAFTTDSWNAAPSPDPQGYRGSIIKISPDGKSVEKVASGIRSVYDLVVSPSRDIFFIDNEGGGNPNEELNKLVSGNFYGHNPKKYAIDSTDSITAPAYALETEIAPSGLAFNHADNNFGGTAGDLFVSFYGPGERWTRGGVGRIRMKKQADGTYSFQEFPVADIPKLSHLAFGQNGDLYLAQHGKSDYWYNAIYKQQGAFYKLVYDPQKAATPPKARAGIARSPLSENAVEAGRQIYAERACLGCHAIDGETELLGPNLKEIGKRMSRTEILEEIQKPSERIKPSMIAQRIVKKDGQVMIGRVVHADEEQLSLMLIGNQVVQVPRKDVALTETVQKSLMYEGLINSLSEKDQEALLDYLVSLSQ